MTLLIQSLATAWHDRDDFYVGGNMFIYFSETQVRNNDFRGPDVFVVLDTERRERKAWVVWEEDGRTPDVVIELLSDSTKSVDFGVKKRIYERVLRVPEYFLFDPFTLEFEGFELESGVYVSKQPSAEGWLRSKRLGLSLGVVRGEFELLETDWLRWFNAEGQMLKTPEEFGRATAQRAELEAQRALAAEARVRELEAELAKRSSS
jgi:Uma2 family endonuclease